MKRILILLLILLSVGCQFDIRNEALTIITIRECNNGVCNYEVCDTKIPYTVKFTIVVEMFFQVSSMLSTSSMLSRQE